MERLKLRVALLGLLWFAYFAYAFGLGTYAPALADYHCPFKLLTGLPCPLCGLTRACFALLHGDWVSALRLNPLAPVAVMSYPMYWMTWRDK